MKPFHILLVEDNEADIFYASEILEDAKIAGEINVVRDGKQAIDFLDKTGEYSGVHFPDLVFLDINIPKKNGHEVLEYIKTNEALKHITVIMLSTSSTQADKDKAYKNLANGFITKPLAIDDVMRAVSEIQHATILYS